MITDWTRALVLFDDKRIAFEDTKKMRAHEIVQTEQIWIFGKRSLRLFYWLLEDEGKRVITKENPIPEIVKAHVEDTSYLLINNN